MALAAPTLSCQKRELATKSHLNNLKRNENIPGIVYGREQNPMPITLGAREVYKVFSSHGARGIFSLDVAGESKPFMSVVRDLQKHPLTGKIIHIDFMTINMMEKFTSSVPVHIVGEEEAAKEGGIVQSGLKEIEVECLPQDLPESITCDISNLEIGSNITVSDIIAPAGVLFLSEPDAVVVTILAPNKATSDEEEAEGTPEAGEGETPEQE